LGVEESDSSPKKIKLASERMALVLASALSNLSGAFMKSNFASPLAATDAIVACHSTVGLGKVKPALSNKQQIQLISSSKKQGAVQPSLANFDQLPDSAFVRQTVVLGLFSCSKATLWRWVKSSRIPSPVKLGNRLSAWQVGPLRACLRQIEASACNGLDGDAK